MRRVGVFIDYSNVHAGARDAFMLDQAAGHRGNINPDFLAKRLALHDPRTSERRRETHALEFVKVFRGAPCPTRDPRGALMEAKRVVQWEKWGATVLRHTLDYGQGRAAEKGVDVRLSLALLKDAMAGVMDVAILASADKDFRYALLEVLDVSDVQVEVATWEAISGGLAVGRIELCPERPDMDEVPCHLLQRGDFVRLEDKVDYRSRPAPPNWKGSTIF